MSYASRAYRHRNAHTHEHQNEQSAFFNKAGEQSQSAKAPTPFFQTKLSVNRPGDASEQEADSVADAVVNHKGGAPVLQQKKITGIQRLATSEADESTSTDEERMKRDKEIQS